MLNYNMSSFNKVSKLKNITKNINSEIDLWDRDCNHFNNYSMFRDNQIVPLIKNCRYGVKCGCFKRICQNKYESKRQKIKDIEHISDFLHPQIYCECIDECEHFVNESVDKLISKSINESINKLIDIHDVESMRHNYLHHHIHTHLTNYNIIERLIKLNCTHVIPTMFENPLFDISYSPPLVLEPRDPNNDLYKKKHEIGTITIIARIAAGCDFETFEKAIDLMRNKNIDINFATVINAFQRTDKRFVELLGRDTIKKFIYKDYPVRKYLRSETNTGSALENNPHAGNIKYEKLINVIIDYKNESENDLKIYELINGWDLISFYDIVNYYFHTEWHCKINEILDNLNNDILSSVPLERFAEGSNISDLYELGFFSVATLVVRKGNYEMFEKMIINLKQNNIPINFAIIHFAIKNNDIRYSECLKQNLLNIEITDSGFLNHNLIEQIKSNKVTYPDVYNLMIECDVIFDGAKSAK